MLWRKKEVSEIYIAVSFPISHICLEIQWFLIHSNKIFAVFCSIPVIGRFQLEWESGKKVQQQNCTWILWWLRILDRKKSVVKGPTVDPNTIPGGRKQNPTFWILIAKLKIWLLISKAPKGIGFRVKNKKVLFLEKIATFHWNIK